MSDRSDIIALIADIFDRRGADAYLGEPVTIADHMLQTAALAQAAGASEPLVAAALLHDIGHFTSAFGSYSPDDTVDRRHDCAGARVLSGHFPPIVVDCVRLHVDAKRYLCAVEPAYHDGLSAASRHSLVLQGGTMDDDAIAAFQGEPFHQAAVSVRQWDDLAKIPGACHVTFDAFRPLLARVISKWHEDAATHTVSPN